MYAKCMRKKKRAGAFIVRQPSKPRSLTENETLVTQSVSFLKAFARKERMESNYGPAFRQKVHCLSGTC